MIALLRLTRRGVRSWRHFGGLHMAALDVLILMIVVVGVLVLAVSVLGFRVRGEAFAEAPEECHDGGLG
jgi:hypothetical protein